MIMETGILIFLAGSVTGIVVTLVWLAWDIARTRW
jgi:hypothetical protein